MSTNQLQYNKIHHGFLSAYSAVTMTSYMICGFWCPMKVPSTCVEPFLEQGPVCCTGQMPIEPALARSFHEQYFSFACHQHVVQWVLLYQMYRLRTVSMHAQLPSHVWLFVTPWTPAHQAPLPTGFPRHEHWSGFPFPPPGDLPQPGDWTRVSYVSCIASVFFTTEPPGKPRKCMWFVQRPFTSKE